MHGGELTEVVVQGGGVEEWCAAVGSDMPRAVSNTRAFAE